LLERNLENFGNTDFAGLADVFAGDKIRITVGNNTREYTIKGIVDNKAGEVALRVYMLDREFRKLAGRTDHNVNEIAVTIADRDQALAIKDQFVKTGLAEHAVVETWEEAQGQFLTDIKDTFGILGTVIGGIGLLVALITIFIIIFINALTRRKYIGILKGIGIPGASIEISYMIQSLFYAITGSLIGLFFIYVVLIPYFAENPIDFPFSDGILVAPISSTMFRLLILIIATIIAGFIPARLIIKKNTLDSILGR
jgi:ABC-type lipoprotein release transport system permease subunit